jgi:nucleoside-diphosphate-sugar epimerase
MGAPSERNFARPMIAGAVRGELVRVPATGDTRLDYTYVVDTAELIVAILDAPDTADRIFYAATGRPLVAQSELAAVIREVVPGARIEFADPDLAFEAARRLVVGRYDVENAKSQLGWEPRFSLKAGVADFVERYRALLAPGAD